jgi:sugar phosphate isomerase/epimerase
MNPPSKLTHHRSTRRGFLQTTASLITLAIAGTAFDTLKSKARLSFTTLGCPDWTFPDIIRFAEANHYDGLEIRGILRELNLPKCKEFSSTENILATRSLMETAHLKFAGLGSSAQLHHRDPVERQRNLDEGKRYIDLAQQLKCPSVRVFPNNLPKDQEKGATLDLIGQGLIELGNYAKGSDVKVLMETHGELVYSADVEKVMALADHPKVGLIWDIVNMWSVTKEPVGEVYQKLKKHIYHTHIKDARFVDGKLKYVLLGDGETPIFEALDLLAKGGYAGYYSFEWEKLWHPEIESPEVALAHFPKAFQKHFG